MRRNLMIFRRLIRGSTALAVLPFIVTACAAPPAAAPDRPVSFDANLWQAARETVSFLPEGSADPVTGTLETGWGEIKPHARDRYRIRVTLDYAQPYEAAAHVIVQHEIKSGEGWLDEADNDAAGAKFEIEIAHVASALRGARKAG